MDIDVVVFSSDPSGTTFTENGAVAIATADVAKVLAAVTVTTKKDLGTPVVASIGNLNIPVYAATDTRDLYACMVVRGAYTPATTSDVTVRFGFEQDA